MKTLQENREVCEANLLKKGELLSLAENEENKENIPAVSAYRGGDRSGLQWEQRQCAGEGPEYKVDKHIGLAETANPGPDSSYGAREIDWKIWWA